MSSFDYDAIFKELLNTIYRDLFFCQTDLMAESAGVKKDTVSKVLNGRLKPSKQIVITFMDIDVKYKDWRLLREDSAVNRCHEKALDRVKFMDDRHPISVYRDEILKSIKWHQETRPAYPISKNYVDHSRWYEDYHRIAQMDNLSPSKLFKVDERLWNFYNNIAKGSLVLNEWKLPRAKEVVRLVMKGSREKQRHLYSGLLENEYNNNGQMS